MKFNFYHSAFLCFFFTCFHTAPAQDSLLKIYKFRTPGFRALQLDLNLNGGFADAKRINAPNASGSNFSSSPTVGYFRIISTDKRQHLSTISLNPRMIFNSNKTNNIKETDRVSGADFKWDFINRYFNSKNLFFEIGNVFESNNVFNRDISATTKFKSANNEFTNQIILGAGKGRLENVQDAQMAIFIINDLQRLGLLNNKPDDATLYQLAALITHINNQRIFDNRIRRIYELTRIDSFLQKTGLIKESSIAYFTTVNDNWALAFNPGRLSGTRIYAQFKPGIRYNFANIEEEANNTVTNKQSRQRFDYFYEPEIGIEHQKPINLHWQKTFTASIRFQQNFSRSNQDIGLPPNNSEVSSFRTSSLATLNSFYGFGYFPNNRTLVYGGIQINSTYNYSDIGVSKGKFFSVEPGLQFSANYFISFRTRAFANANLSWRYTEQLNDLPTALVYNKTQVNGNINIGFTHIIF